MLWYWLIAYSTRDGDSGVELIRRVKADESLRAVPLLLVSNYADAQLGEAVDAAPAGAGQGGARSAGDARPCAAVLGRRPVGDLK